MMRRGQDLDPVRSDHPAESDSSVELPIGDATAERLLAGADATPDLQPLASVVEALRQEARRPVSPSPALAALMAGGIRPSRAPAHQSRPARHAAGGVLAHLGRVRTAIAAAAAGVVVALTSAVTAGFAGVLPPEVQDQFDLVVENLTPDDLRAPAGSGGDPGGTGHESGDQHQPAEDETERGQRRVQQSGGRGPEGTGRQYGGEPPGRAPGRDAASPQDLAPDQQGSSKPDPPDAAGPPGPAGPPGASESLGPPHQPGPPWPLGP